MIDSLVSAGVGAGVRVTSVGTAEQLVPALLECWAEPHRDVFDFDLAVVPGTGFQRWLSQRLAVASGDRGVRAGVEFSTLGRLLRRLDAEDDPWRPERLTWVLQRLTCDPADPALEPLVRHLEVAREPYSACSRVARMFAGYASHRPEMLSAWARGEDVGPQGEPLAESTWQAHLWRLAAAELGETPAERHGRLLDRLREGPAEGVPGRVAVMSARLGPQAAEVLQALSVHHQVDLVMLTPSPSRSRQLTGRLPARADFRRPIGHPLNEALGTVADEQALVISGFADPEGRTAAAPASPTLPVDSLLDRLQADLRADAPPLGHRLAADDRSIQVHLSHGLDRQVEVLREVLAELFAADPTLEPRHLAVVTPAVDAVASLVTAAFANLPNGHPAGGFRVHLADRSVAETNPLVGLLLDLLRLPESRVESATLLDLCAQEAVARRFGFTPEGRDRLVELVERSGIKWGLSARQRQAFALDGFPQNTWFAGVQRMLLGVTLSEQDLVTAGTTLPLDDIDSSDVELVGGLTELIGRVQRLIALFEPTATAPVWVERCRTAIDSLASPPPQLQWQLADLWAGLARFAERAGEGTVLSRQAVRKALTEQFRGTLARGAFGNGSLIVCGPASLRHVPHRVTVLLGFDAERYPRPARPGGDDLLSRCAMAGDPSSALDDRQLLLDAVHATREKLVIVARGRSEATNEPVALAAPVQELLDALDQTAPGCLGTVCRQHPLQPFDPRYFDPAVPEFTSVDPIAYTGAVASQQPPAVTRDPYRLGTLPPWRLDAGVELDELVTFYGHPVRTLLRRRAGLGLSEPRESPSTIPIELDGLQRWQIGDRMLRRILAGEDPEAVRRAEWLRGGVPPFELGQAVLDAVLQDVRAVRRALPSWHGATPIAHDLLVEVEVPGHGQVPLTGRVSSREGKLLQVEFSSLQPRHRLAAWLRLLALTAAGIGAGEAVVIGKSRSATLSAPPRAEASRLLGRYLALYALGMSTPLPALPRVGAQWAALRLAERDPQDPKAGEGLLKRAWQYDFDENWAVFFGYPEVLDLPAAGAGLPDPVAGERTLVGALAQVIWEPILAAEGTR